MTRPAVLFLILLRLAIGWHFLAEAWPKLPSDVLLRFGLATNHKPFSAVGYFREATGPLGDKMRAYNGDPDELALARLTMVEAPASQKDSKDRLPKPLRAEWDGFLIQTAAHYNLDGKQKELAQAEMDAAAAEVVRLFNYVADPDPAKRDAKLHEKSVTIVTRALPGSDELKRDMTLTERVDEYKARLAALRELFDKKLWLFGKDVEKDRLQAAKAEVASLRGNLMADLDKQTKAFQDAVRTKVLTDKQKEMDVPTPQKVPTVLTYVDAVTPWVLFGIGVSLLVGLFTRLGSFAGVVFLLMTYLASPPFPWLPIAVPSESQNYLFVNKNLIEMLALCVLMCLPTGRWFGLDAVLNVFGRLFFGDKPQPAVK